MAWVVAVSEVHAGDLSGNSAERDVVQSLRLEPPVNLDFDGQPLREAVALVNQRSGICFQLADVVRDTPVSQKIAARGWNQAVAELLKGFSFLGIIDDMGRNTYRLVHLQQHSWSNDDSLGATRLDSLRRDAAAQNLRTHYGADMIAGLVPQSGNLCGIGYVPFGDKATFTAR